MTIANSAMRGVPTVLQNAQTTGDGSVIVIPSSFKNHTLIIKGSAGVSAGAIQPETTGTDQYAGTWAQLGGGPITVAASAELIYNFVGTFLAIRARISTDIVGGTVTVTYVGS